MTNGKFGRRGSVGFLTAQLRYVVLHVDASLARVLQHVITRGYPRAIVVPARVLRYVITRGLPGGERVYT